MMETCEKCGQEKPDALRRDGRDIPSTQKKRTESDHVRRVRLGVFRS
jgi:hypothetical protein